MTNLNCSKFIALALALTFLSSCDRGINYRVRPDNSSKTNVKYGADLDFKIECGAFAGMFKTINTIVNKDTKPIKIFISDVHMTDQNNEKIEIEKISLGSASSIQASQMETELEKRDWKKPIDLLPGKVLYVIYRSHSMSPLVRFEHQGLGKEGSAPMTLVCEGIKN